MGLLRPSTPPRPTGHCTSRWADLEVADAYAAPPTPLFGGVEACTTSLAPAGSRRADHRVTVFCHDSETARSVQVNGRTNDGQRRHRKCAARSQAWARCDSALEPRCPSSIRMGNRLKIASRRPNASCGLVLLRSNDTHARTDSRVAVRFRAKAPVQKCLLTAQLR